MMFHGVPLDCINQAAISYHVPASIIVSVIKIENGRNGLAVKNENGTYDLGVMQINTSWLKQLQHYGITKEMVQYDACVNVTVGAWILAKGIAKSEGWVGLGNYHSATPKYNLRYREKLKKTFHGVVRAMSEVKV